MKESLDQNERGDKGRGGEDKNAAIRRYFSEPLCLPNTLQTTEPPW